MNRPVIGLTMYGVAHAPRYNLPPEYVLAVERAGGVPLLLPPTGTEAIDRWLSVIQGLVLSGGGDIDPALYGAPPHESIYNVDPIRDASEVALARLAVDRNLPTLAICRGLQVINVALNGTLHRHLPEVVGESVAHRLPPREPSRHMVEVQEQAVVARAMRSTRVDIVSWHHQAIERLGDGLRAVAWAEDGVIEAVELDGNPALLAVQWHPELSAAEDPTQQRLFSQLVELAASEPSAAGAGRHPAESEQNKVKQR